MPEYADLFGEAARVSRDVFVGAALGGSTGAIIGGEFGLAGGSLVLPGFGTVAAGGAGMITGAVTGALAGASAALATDLAIMYRKVGDGGTPKQAQIKNDRQQGPREIKRIDGPNNQPNSQWHAHGKNGGAINQDGTIHDCDPGFTRKSLNWLRDHGWKI